MILKRLMIDLLYAFILLEVILVLWSDWGSIIHPMPYYFWRNLKYAIHDTGFPYFSVVYFIFVIVPYELLIINRRHLFRGLSRKFLLFLGLQIFWALIVGSFMVNLFMTPWYYNLRLLLLLILLAISFVVFHYYTIDKPYEQKQIGGVKKIQI